MSARAAVAMAAGPGPFARLLRHERLVVTNLLFRSTSTWRERLRWILALPVLIVFGHFWLTGMPLASAARTASGAVGFLALSITRSAAKRIVFHREDGLMAADALRPGVAWRFRALYTSVSLTGIAIIVALLDMRVLPACLAAMGAGVLLGALLNLATSIDAIRRAWALALRVGAAWLRKPAAGFVLAGVFGVFAWLLARYASEIVAISTAGSIAFACGLFLSPVDAALVRFMAQSGFPVARTLRAYTPGLVTFVPPASLIAFALFGIDGAAMILALAAVNAAILCLRVLTYRLYDKWLADWITTLLVATLGVVGAGFAPALPVAAAAIAWALWRRARATTWLFAA